MTDQTPAMTMREIREGLGHVEPGVPEVFVSITRYAASVLPAGDINRKYFTVHVELTGNGWIVTDGHLGFTEDGTGWTGSRSGHYFADHEDAVALARKVAPALMVNGRTALEIYRRNYPTAATDPAAPSRPASAAPGAV